MISNDLFVLAFAKIRLTTTQQILFRARFITVLNETPDVAT